MRRGSLGLVVVVALVGALTLPSAAFAGRGHHHQPCTSSAVCQYLEHIPGAGGDQSTSPGGGGGGGGGGSNSGGQPAVSPTVQQQLESHGAVGAKTAALANATAPAGVPGSGGSGSTSDHGALAGAGGGPDATGGAPEIGTALSHVLGAGGSGSGMGIALPIIMLLSLVAALLLAFARRRGAIQS